MLPRLSKRFFLSLLTFLICNQSISQEKQDKFPFTHVEYFQSKHGLSGNDVFWTTQDNAGFMWFITDVALNRFDGHSFRSYSYKPNDPNSLSSDLFWGLAVDKNGILWIPGYQSGLYSFNPKLEKFTSYRHQPGNKNSLYSDRVTAVVPGKDGLIWIGSYDGLDKFDPKTNTFTHFPLTTRNDQTKNPKWIVSLILDEDNHDLLWIVDGNTLDIECFQTKSGKVTERFKFPFPSSSYQWNENSRLNISENKNGNIWFGSTDSGIFGFNTRSREFTLVKTQESCKNERHINGFYSAVEDKEGNLWTTNDNNDVVFYDKLKKKFFHLPVTGKGIKFIDNASILYQDRNNKIWICTNNGLIAVDTKQKNITVCKVSQENNSISADFVYSIFRTRQGEMLVGTPAGIDVFDKKSQSFSRLNLLEDGKLVNPYETWTMFQDSKNIVWFAGVFGIASYNPFTKKARLHRLHNDSVEFSTALSITVFEDKKGRYWAGNFTGGLFKFDPETDKARQFTEQKSGPFFIDSKGKFYMHGWQGGLITFDPDNEKFKVYRHDANDPNSLSHENALGCIEDRNGLIWMSTLGGGICVFNPVTEKFVTFTTDHGLPHNWVVSLIKDKNGNYWAGTLGGLSCFTPPENAFSPGVKIKFRNYDVSDGLPTNTLNRIAAFCDNDGTLYFGTRTDGMFYFHPNDLKDNDYIPPVYITTFQVKNKTITVNDSSNILKTAIEYTKEIKLNYKQNLLSFAFSSLNYVHPEKNKYAYMLEGYDQEWVYTDASKRFASYTNLDPGKYTFKVKASNNDGIWNEKPTELKIWITPPFWKTPWFYSLLAIAILGLLYAGYRYRLREILKLQNIRNKIAADLHDDIGSTLNSISVFSEVAQNDPSRRSHSLQMIGESSRKVIDAMSDIVWTINPDNDNFEKIILRMRSLAYNLLRAKNIEFNFRADESLNDLKLTLVARRNFYFIFKEILNNLIKYSQAKTVSILLENKSNIVHLLIKDDGVGFDVKRQYNGNGLTNIRRRSKEINAALHIESVQGAGTIIQLILKP